MRQTLLPLLSTGLVVFSGHAPAAAQIFGGSSNPRNIRQQQRQAVTGPATTGTVPGIYYDPSGQLSPSLSQLPPAEQAGFFALPSRYQSPALRKLGYNPSRAWAKGATPDRMLKVGDLQQSKQFQNIGKMTMRQMATMAGTDIERVPLSQIPLVAEMTVGELYKVYPQLNNVPLKEISFLSQTLAAAARNPKALGYGALDLGSQRAVQELAAIDPRLANVPLGSIVRGDWDGALSQSKAAAAKLAAQELVKVHPALGNVPVGDILKGNWRGIQRAALDMGQKALVQELARNPALEGIPLSQLAAGDWGGAISELQQGKLKDLIKDVPALQNLPIDQAFPMVNGVIAGDWQSVSQQAVKLGWELAGDDLLKAVPELKDLPLGSLPIDGLSIASLPGLVDRPLETIPNIGSKYLTKLPGLSKVPVDKLPLNYVFSVLRGDLFGRLDIAYAGPVETPITSVVTGGTKDQKFKPEPCREKRCPHFELDNVEGAGPPGSLSGKAWVEGKAQKVPGGKGMLAKVNNGKEPTGIPVWGLDENVKLSLENIQEGSNGQPSTAEVWANIQLCFDAPFIGEQCTPHFLPVPLPVKVKEGGLMIIASAGKPPDMVRQARDQARSQYAAQFGAGQDNAGMGSVDGCSVHRGVHVGALKQAIHLTESAGQPNNGHDAIGRMLPPVPSDPQWIVALGRYQFMTNRREVIQAVSKVSGGQQWLASIAQGRRPTISELQRYFPSQVQEQIMNQEAKILIDKAYAKGARSPGEMAAVAAMIHHGGDGYNPTFSDGGMTTGTYGGRVSADYQRFNQVAQKQCAKIASAAAGPVNQRIRNAAGQMYGYDSSGTSSGGREACVWAVNRVLERAGLKPFGTEWVPTVAQNLENGRGSRVSLSQAKPGDIILAKGYEHIGVCMTNGCTEVLSNSSSNASFSWRSGPTFNGTYDSSAHLGDSPTEQIWRLKY